MRVDFYHLTASPVEAVLPRLVQRVLDDGARALVRAEEPGLLAQLDAVLWSFAPDSFLPHGLEGGSDDATQPVLLSADPAPLNAATRLILADGRWIEPPAGYERVFFLFGEDEIAAARAAWRTVDGERHYWKQDGRGRWTEGP